MHLSVCGAARTRWTGSWAPACCARPATCTGRSRTSPTTSRCHSRPHTRSAQRLLSRVSHAKRRHACCLRRHECWCLSCKVSSRIMLTPANLLAYLPVAAAATEVQIPSDVAVPARQIDTAQQTLISRAPAPVTPLLQQRVIHMLCRWRRTRTRQRRGWAKQFTPSCRAQWRATCAMGTPARGAAWPPRACRCSAPTTSALRPTPYHPTLRLTSHALHPPTQLSPDSGSIMGRTQPVVSQTGHLPSFTAASQAAFDTACGCVPAQDAVVAVVPCRAGRRHLRDVRRRWPGPAGRPGRHWRCAARGY